MPWVVLLAAVPVWLHQPTLPAQPTRLVGTAAARMRVGLAEPRTRLSLEELPADAADASTTVSTAPDAPPAPPPRPPPPPPRLSLALLAADGSIAVLFSLACSIGALFQNGEYLEPARLDSLASDMTDIALALDDAAALAVGWLLAAAATGACDEDWVSLPDEEHERSPVGSSRVLRTWALGWPLGEALKQVAEDAASLSRRGEALEYVHVDWGTVAIDGAGLILVFAVWRGWLRRNDPFNPWW